MQQLPNKIKVRFTKGDLKKAENYSSNTDCLLATALKRLGFESVTIGAMGFATIAGVDFASVNPFNATTVCDWTSGQGRYFPSLAGKKMTLKRV